ncbi:MAG: hypothetical protein KA163_10940 [Bacteroidia bacterium]|nr:hypothetical protein [Bacteroidia bacterium]
MKLNSKIFFLFFLIGVSASVVSQNSTFSPYSRFGLGELNSPAFAQIGAMGGSYIGFKPDTTAPLFINVANPASISGIRLTTLELGGIAQFSEFNNGISKVKTKTVNFSYGSLGFPIKQRAGAVFGILPFSNVGYNLKSDTWSDAAGGYITNKYVGEGGVNRVFLGFGILPFKKVLTKFYSSAERDSLIAHKKTKEYKRKKFGKQLLSDLSLGVRGDYLFGNVLQTSSVIYPGSVNYYNTRRYRSVNYGDVTGCFGLQTSFVIDSVGKRELKKKVRIGFGYFVSIPNTIAVKNSYLAYNYSLNSFGDEVAKDTFIYVIDQKTSVRLPLEQGIGMSIKKGDMLNIAVDASYTNWQQFRYLDNVNTLKNSYRVSFGLNFVPNKYAAGSGAYIRRIQYRIGAFYNTGFLELKNTMINNYAATVGLGLPVGLFRQFSMVNLSAQFGQMGSINNGLMQEKYVRIIVGFTFNDKWFNKFRYD